MNRRQLPAADDRCLEALSPLQPDLNHSERVRARCHLELQRRRDRKAQVDQFEAFAANLLPLAVVGGLCVVYAAVFMAETLRLRGVDIR